MNYDIYPPEDYEYSSLDELIDLWASTPWNFYIHWYSYTDCGVTITMKFGSDEELCNDELPHRDWDTSITKLKVSSIIEGSSAEVPGYWIDNPNDFFKLLNVVEEEANNLWEETNNEPS
jgi:hypothetical protein